MVRPRLVTEGKPLVDDHEIEEWEHDESEAMETLGQYPGDDHSRQPQHPSQRQRPTMTTQPSIPAAARHSTNSSGSPRGVSSLAMAAAGLSSSSRHQPPRTRHPVYHNSYRVEIGSTSTRSTGIGTRDKAVPKEDQDNDSVDMMMMDTSDGESDSGVGQKGGPLHYQSWNHGSDQQPSHYATQQLPASHTTLHSPQHHYNTHNQPNHYRLSHHQHHHPTHFVMSGGQEGPPPHSHSAPPSNITHSSSTKSRPPHSHHIEIGAPPPTERMEGVTKGPMGPLVVIDGANVAYAYADALSDHHHHHPGRSNRLDPNVQGIHMACHYFGNSRVRVLVVLPASYMKAKPRDGSSGNALMETEQWDVLHHLKQQGKLVLSPPTDDDDAYVLTIGVREWERQQQQQQEQSSRQLLGAYCLSNDLFRDAQERNPRVREWLGSSTSSGNAGRISYAFVDMGQVDDHGERLLELVPNPRHELIAWMEQEQQQGLSNHQGPSQRGFHRHAPYNHS